MSTTSSSFAGARAPAGRLRYSASAGIFASVPTTLAVAATKVYRRSAVCEVAGSAEPRAPYDPRIPAASLAVVEVDTLKAGGARRVGRVAAIAGPPPRL